MKILISYINRVEWRGLMTLLSFLSLASWYGRRWLMERERDELVMSNQLYGSE